MGYVQELQFVEKLLHNFRLNLRYISEEAPMFSSPSPNLGLKDILHYEYKEDHLLSLLKEHCKSNTIYQVQNLLLCNYLLFRLPDTPSPVYAYIGPYTLSPIYDANILEIAERYQITPGNLEQLKQFYYDLPLLSDENLLLTLLYTLGEYLWDNSDCFTIQREFPLSTSIGEVFLPAPNQESSEETLVTMQILEKRYETEQLLIQAVSNGQVHKAELYLSNLSSRQYEQRTNNPTRNLQNYAIVLNTILRKAVENAAVHPLHIDSISSQFSRKIEAVTSESHCSNLIKEMVRKYCLLVKNHSLKGYSLLIRKVIARIDFDLTADLSLKTQAQLLNVNPSYLSTLFKKETGSTLTEYVNRKRIEHALLLLNSTDMQIQMIAQYCGIADVNYFTKTFKKIVGKTPKEYREMISGHL